MRVLTASWVRAAMMRSAPHRHKGQKEAGGIRVRFDLAAFRYIAYDNPLHLRNQCKIALDALFDNDEDS
jgi:hypothetical protein